METKLKFIEIATQSDHQLCRATVSTGLHVRRATGITVTERDGSFTGTESAVRWSRDRRGAYGAERKRSSAVQFFVFDLCKVFQSGRKLLHKRGRGNFSFPRSSVSFSLFNFVVLLCPTVCAFSFVHTTYISKKEISTLVPGVRTYVRHAAFKVFS